MCISNIKRTLVFLFISVLFLNSCEQGEQRKVIMVIFAHPDDETTIGPVLAKYAENNDLYLVLATDGRWGVTEHAGIPAGDTLVAIRNEEAACSCKALGINPPIHLGAADGLGLANEQGDYYGMVNILKEKIDSLIREYQPDLIITFGPGGDTGHSDHRLIGAITTEVVLKERLGKEMRLFYFEWTKEQNDKYHWWGLNYADQEMLPTVISYDSIDRLKAIESIKCYTSQYTKAEMDVWISAELEDETKQLNFRQVIINDKTRSDFFE